MITGRLKAANKTPRGGWPVATGQYGGSTELHTADLKKSYAKLFDKLVPDESESNIFVPSRAYLLGK